MARRAFNQSTTRRATPARGDHPRPVVKKVNAVAGEVSDKKVLDAALINAAQAVEHYDICRYGTLVAWARRLGKSKAALLFQATLDEEEATDAKLTQLADGCGGPPGDRA